MAVPGVTKLGPFDFRVSAVTPREVLVALQGKALLKLRHPRRFEAQSKTGFARAYMDQILARPELTTPAIFSLLGGTKGAFASLGKGLGDLQGAATGASSRADNVIGKAGSKGWISQLMAEARHSLLRPQHLRRRSTSHLHTLPPPDQSLRRPQTQQPQLHKNRL